MKYSMIAIFNLMKMNNTSVQPPCLEGRAVLMKK